MPHWPRRPAADQYRAFFTHLARLLGRRVVVERSAASLLQIPQLRRLFPGARFVHMYRDGPDCALSMSRRPAFRREMLLVHAMKTARAAGLDTPSPRRIEDAMPERFRGLLVPPYDAPRFRAYPLPVAAFARGYWTAMVRAGVSALAEVPADRRADLRYEDLLADPDGELTRLAGFLGVPAPAAWLTAARHAVDPARRGAAEAQLSPEEYAAVRAACAPGTQALAAAAEAVGRAPG